MRLLTIILAGILFILSGCKNTQEKDFSELEKMVLVTDSLLMSLQNQYDFTSENFYLLSDDSAKVDSLTQVLNLTDSFGFYQYLEQSLGDFNEIFIQTQEEIYFAKDQLSSLKNEFLYNEISESEYLLEITEFKEIIKFLENRVDSNIFLINSEYNPLFFTSNDSVL